MMDEVKFHRYMHSSVCLDNRVVIFGGRLRKELLSTRVIWTYNLYTDEWRKHLIPDSKEAPKPFSSAVAAAINGTIYTFGGVDTKSRNALLRHRNAVWTLDRTEECFKWTFIEPECAEKSPSPRTMHTGWEYAGNLWTFGGLGSLQEGYLNDHGDFHGYSVGVAVNNQLLCFDTNTNKWTNPQCCGDVPSPRRDPTSAIIKNKVWLFGGYESIQYAAPDIFELCMHSLTWTRIQTDQHRPQARNLCTLTVPVTGDKLVLHGGNTGMKLLSDTWIMDVTSHSWRIYTSESDHDRYCHTGSSNLNNNVIIFGGKKDSLDTSEMYNNIFHVMFEPKCLQQLAMKIIYKYWDQLPLKLLPAKLISKLGA